MAQASQTGVQKLSIAFEIPTATAGLPNSALISHLFVFSDKGSLMTRGYCNRFLLKLLLKMNIPVPEAT